MEWLNYHHLLYFWMVAKHGSITRASAELRLAHPTISGQIHRLEEALGEKLFARSGRNLVLTDSGRVAFRYADEIFALGQEFQDALKGRSPGKPLRLVVGVSDVIAKSIVHRILEPAFQLQDKVHVVCREARSPDAFMAELAVHAVDVVLADAPAGAGVPVRAFSHPLGEWFQSRGIGPEVIAELDDIALASILGEKGLGVLAAPDVMAKELGKRYGLALVGRAKGIRQRFFALSVERKIKHPAVAAICEVARKKIFARSDGFTCYSASNY